MSEKKLYHDLTRKRFIPLPFRRVLWESAQWIDRAEVLDFYIILASCWFHPEYFYIFDLMNDPILYNFMLLCI